MSILVVAEHDNSELKTATLNTIAAAQKVGGNIDLLVVGHECNGVSEAAAKVVGISKVLVADAPELTHHLAENVAPILVNIAKNYSHIFAPATTFGKNIMPRAAALLDVAQMSDISDVVSGDTFVRLIYAGNAIATVQSSDELKLVTVRTTKFEPVDAEGGAATVEALAGSGDSGLSSFMGQDVTESERPELTTAKVVISGGRGMQNGENFGMLEKIADKLNAAVGASRAAVDAGYVPNDYQVGQTGKVVAPDLYIAVGISGAIQHLAGMKDSKVIAAINNDSEAPIFQIADYGLVADLLTALPEFLAELEK